MNSTSTQKMKWHNGIHLVLDLTLSNNLTVSRKNMTYLFEQESPLLTFQNSIRDKVI